jgi:hypothetical protein
MGENESDNGGIEGDGEGAPIKRQSARSNMLLFPTQMRITCANQADVRSSLYIVTHVDVDMPLVSLIALEHIPLNSLPV